jgi:hypothetical protein
VPGLTELANGVLTKLGDAMVSSLDDGSTAAQLIKANIDRLRRAELRKYRWNFAGEAASLPEVLPAPPFRWAHAYALPGGSLRLLDVYRGPFISGSSWSPPRADYQLQGVLVLTNEAAPLNVRYGRDVPDVGAWDAAFFEVMACKIAAELCERFTQSAGKKQQLEALYQQAVSDAKRLDAIEDEPQELSDPGSWVRSRFGGFGSDYPELWGRDGW